VAVQIDDLCLVPVADGKETEVWTLSFAVDATTWSEYESTFATAAESFRVSGAVP